MIKYTWALLPLAVFYACFYIYYSLPENHLYFWWNTPVTMTMMLAFMAALIVAIHKISKD